VLRRGDDLAQVVRGHVGGHAHGDAGGAVDQQVREGRGEHLGLHELVVVVGDEVDHVLVEVRRHGHGGGCQPGLGVAGRGRTVIQRTEVAVAVDQRQAQGEVLGQAHHRVVDGGVAVRVQLAHHFADHAGRLHVALFRAQAHLRHLEQDAPLHRLQAVAGIGQRARIDDGVGVLQERGFHFAGDIDVDNVLHEIRGEIFRLLSSHEPVIPSSA